MTHQPGRLVLLGHPVAHSLSPAFQNAALTAAGIDLKYEALDVTPSSLSPTLAALVKSNAAGNVTVPHKLAVAAACAELTPAARRTGAVNTFVSRDGGLVGHNTDVAGFETALRELLGGSPKGKTFGVFGAGGAAAGVLAAIENVGGKALVANRDAGRAIALCERFGSVAQSSDADEIAKLADIVVNATTLGMHGEAGPIDPSSLRRAEAVLDLVYTANETEFVRAARRRGLKATDGLSMLIAQGAASFSWWFGRSPDVGVMWRAVGRPSRVDS